MRSTVRKLSLLIGTLFILPFVVLVACGKKGPPTLTSFEKPEAPFSVTALHRGGAIILRWNYPRRQEDSIAEFIILRSSGTDFEKRSHLEKDKRIFVDQDITTGITYRYRVVAQNSRGVYSDGSPEVIAAPAPVPPPPANLSYTIQGDRIILTWKPHSSGDKFNIYKSREKGVYGLTPLNPTPLSESVFSDTFSVQSIEYYTVRSLTGTDIRDEGAASEELVFDPADLVPSRPVDIQAYPSSDRIFLSWSEPPESWVTGYRIYKRISGPDYLLVGETQIPAFVDIASPFVRRDYRVTAVGPAKEGPPAEISNVMFTPQR